MMGKAKLSLWSTLLTIGAMFFSMTPMAFAGEADIKLPDLSTVFFTIMGNTVAEAVPALTGAGADILGSNCGHGLATMVEIAAEFRRHWTGPLLIQANAGLPGMRDGVPFWPETPEDFAAGATALLALRVNLIGGCCGTTPAHTAAIRQAVDRGGRPRQL